MTDECRCSILPDCDGEVAADAELPKVGWQPVCEYHKRVAWDRGLFIRAHQSGCVPNLDGPVQDVPNVNQ